MSYIPKSKKQEHLTPDRVYDIIEDVWKLNKKQLYDPTPAGTPYKAPIFFNGLYGDWESFNYVNPMFATKTLTAFVIKAVEQSDKGRISIMLLPPKTDQDWFHNYIKPILYNSPRDIYWISKRLKFKNDKDTAGGSHFLVMIK